MHFRWPATGRANYLIAGCSIFLGIALLVYAGLIAQRAYELLLTEHSVTDDRGIAVFPAVIDRAAEATGTIIAQPLQPPTVTTPSITEVAGEVPTGGFPEDMTRVAKPAPARISPERRTIVGTRPRRRHKDYIDVQPSWGPTLW